MRTSSTLLLLLCCSTTAMAQTDSTRLRAEFDSLVAAHTHQISLEGRTLHGAGLEWLLREAASSHYFMIGEQHLTRELTFVEGAILARLPALGYGRFAVEIGPWSTPVAEAHIRAGTLDSVLSRPDRALAIPFLFQREFAEMFSAFVRAVPGKGPVLMGLDQEFIAAGPVLAEVLMAEARTPDERTAAMAFSEAVGKEPFLIGQSDGSAIRAAQSAFAATGSARARELLADLLVSHEIYAPFSGRGGSVQVANAKREAYIKRNLVAQLAQTSRAGDSSKVVAVFGANHAIRGFSPTQVLGLGNFMEEFATSRGERFFNLHVDCLGGNMSNPQTGAAVPCPSYFLGEGGALREVINDTQTTLIDLRALRGRLGRFPFLSERERMLILGFDAYLAVPNVTPASLYSGGR